MIASLKGYGKIARALLAALGVFLILGIVGSMWMGSKARTSARDEIVHQAQAITDSSLSLAFQPSDLSDPATADRANALSDDIKSIVIDPSDFQDVTLYSPEGTILYSTQTSRIGNNLPGEKDSIKEALRGIPQTTDFDGTMSVMLPLRFRSGVGPPAAVELTHPDATVAAAAGPWRTNAFFLFALLVLLGVAVFGVARLLAVVADPAAAEAETVRPMTIPSLQQSRALTTQPTQPGMREEGEARRRAEERARAAEDRLSLLQEQYGKTLEELQTYQAAPATQTGGIDPVLEERALRAEGQVRTLEQQIRTVTAERERLAGQLQDALRAPIPDAEDTARLREAELEAISLRAALEDTREKFAETQLELDAIRTSAATAPDVKAELDAARAEARESRDALTAAEAQLLRTQRELEDTRIDLDTAQAAAATTPEVKGELDAARVEMLEMQSTLTGTEAQLLRRPARAGRRADRAAGAPRRGAARGDARGRGSLREGGARELPRVAPGRPGRARGGVRGEGPHDPRGLPAADHGDGGVLPDPGRAARVATDVADHRRRGGGGAPPPRSSRPRGARSPRRGPRRPAVSSNCSKPTTRSRACGPRRRATRRR